MHLFDMIIKIIPSYLISLEFIFERQNAGEATVNIITGVLKNKLLFHTYLLV